MEDATGSAAPPRAAPVDATKRPHFVARPATRIPPEGADGSNLDAFTSIDVDLMNQLFAGENYQKILCQSVLWKGKTLDINPIMRKTDGDTNGVECVWIAVPLSSEHAAKWTAKEVLDIFELCFDRLRYVRVVLVIEVFSPENQDPPASARVSSNPEGSSRARPSAASLAVIRDNIPENASSPPQGHNRPPMSAKKTPSGVVPSGFALRGIQTTTNKKSAMAIKGSDTAENGHEVDSRDGDRRDESSTPSDAMDGQESEERLEGEQSGSDEDEKDANEDNEDGEDEGISTNMTKHELRVYRDALANQLKAELDRRPPEANQRFESWLARRGILLSAFAVLTSGAPHDIVAELRTQFGTLPTIKREFREKVIPIFKRNELDIHGRDKDQVSQFSLEDEKKLRSQCGQIAHSRKRKLEDQQPGATEAKRRKGVDGTDPLKTDPRKNHTPRSKTQPVKEREEKEPPKARAKVGTPTHANRGRVEPLYGNDGERMSDGHEPRLSVESGDENQEEASSREY